jgi:hypothetical protein
MLPEIRADELLMLDELPIVSALRIPVSISSLGDIFQEKISQFLAI